MKRRNSAEEMFTDIIVTLKEKQKDLESAVNQYRSNAPFKPAVDVVEYDEEVSVLIELPGVKKKDIKIDITDQNLDITANFNEEAEFNQKIFLTKERYYGKVKRIIKLPARIKINDSYANFENGVLKIILPKLKKEKNFEVKVD
jgi:HSP20 family protein